MMCTRCAFLAGAAAMVAAPALGSARAGDPKYLEIAMPSMQRVADTVWLGRLSANVWIHTTTKIIDSSGGYFPANGLIVVDETEAMLIDAGWDTLQARTIIDAWKATGNPLISHALITHFHEDRIGGVPELKRQGIPAFGNPETIRLALRLGYMPPQPLENVERHPVRMGSIEVFYPGQGHTIDNIVAWIPSNGVLFGGCLVKSVTAAGLGNIADANVHAWPATMHALTKQYPDSRYVVPGHGTVRGDSLAHTLTLAIAGKS